MRCVTLTNVAELLQRKYNNGSERTADNEDLLEIINDPSTLSHTELGNTICRCQWCFYIIVTMLTWIPDRRGLVTDIVEYINQPELPNMIRWFLHHKFSNDSNTSNSDVDISALPDFTGRVRLHSGALSIFFAPSDPCGIHSLRWEQIWSTWTWRGGALQQDTVLVNTGEGGSTSLPMSGYIVARVLLFFSFNYAGNDFPVALLWWYTLSEDSGCRDKETGMWLVECKYRNGGPHLVVVSVGTIFHVVHLLPFFGWERIIWSITQDNSLDSYCMYYVNRYVDHQAFKIL